MFQTIVFAYDGSTASQEALVEGVALASRFKSTCYLLAVVPRLPDVALATGMLPGELIETQYSSINAVLTEGLERLRQAGLSATGILRTDSRPFDAIAVVARETDADLVVIGHHPRNIFGRWWFGSVSHSVMDQLPCSLLVSMHDASKPNWTESLLSKDS